MKRSKHYRVGQVWCDEHWVYYVLKSNHDGNKWWNHLCLRLNNFTMILMAENRERAWGESWCMKRVA